MHEPCKAAPEVAEPISISLFTISSSDSGDCSTITSSSIISCSTSGSCITGGRTVCSMGFASGCSARQTTKLPSASATKARKITTNTSALDFLGWVESSGFVSTGDVGAAGAGAADSTLDVNSVAAGGVVRLAAGADTLITESGIGAATVVGAGLLKGEGAAESESSEGMGGIDDVGMLGIADGAWGDTLESAGVALPSGAGIV